MWKGIVAAIVGAAFLSACESADRTYTGSVPGANSGVLVNSEVASGSGQPPIGAIEGIFAGAEIGRSLDQRDRELAAKAEYDALEYARPGFPTKWSNPESGNSGTILAAGTVEINKLDCRNYSHTVSIDGRTRVANGVACRQPGGTWRMIS